MTLTTDERQQFLNHNVTIHPKTMSDQEGRARAEAGRSVVFRESVSTPGDLTLFVPGSGKFRLSDLKSEYPDRFGADKNIHESVVSIFGFPVHSKKEIVNHIKKTVHCHSTSSDSGMTEEKSIALAKKENALVFYQPKPFAIGYAYSPSDYIVPELQIYSPNGDHITLEIMIEKHPEKFININDAVKSITDIMGAPPHELLTKAGVNYPPVIVRNPDLPVQTSSPSSKATGEVASFKSEMSTIKNKGGMEALRERDIVLKKASVTVEEAIQMAVTNKCCVLRESDSDPTGVTVYSPTGEKWRLKDIAEKKPECLNNDENLSKTLQVLTHFPMITEDQLVDFNQQKSTMHR